jgi:hypothetical protein
MRRPACPSPARTASPRALRRTARPSSAPHPTSTSGIAPLARIATLGSPPRCGRAASLVPPVPTQWALGPLLALTPLRFVMRIPKDIGTMKNATGEPVPKEWALAAGQGSPPPSRLHRAAGTGVHTLRHVRKNTASGLRRDAGSSCLTLRCNVSYKEDLRIWDNISSIIPFYLFSSKPASYTRIPADTTIYEFGLH